MSVTASALLALAAELGPYFRIGTGPAAGGGWRPTAALREPTVVADVVAQVADRLGTGETRVAASTWFFGYAARLWSPVLATVVLAGRSVRLDPATLLWRSERGSLQLHCATPALGGPPLAEVLDTQLEPLIRTLADVVAPGVLWGNAAAALLGAAPALGEAGRRAAADLLGDPRLRGTVDPETGRRRTCCLFYRTSGGGVCGDCPFPRPPA